MTDECLHCIIVDVLGADPRINDCDAREMVLALFEVAYDIVVRFPPDARQEMLETATARRRIRIVRLVC